MKLDADKLAKMSDADLAALNSQVSDQRDALRAEQQKIKAVQDHRSAEAAAQRKFDRMPQAERDALAKRLKQ